MQFTEKISITQHQRMPIERFLQTHPSLLQLADDGKMSAMEFIADGFLPDMLPGEGCDEWVVRQVQEVLNTQLWRDMVEGYEQDGQGMHVCRHVEQVEFDAIDQQFIVTFFGSMPEVQAMWRQMTQSQSIAA